MTTDQGLALKTTSLLVKIADSLAEAIGSWPFILGQSVIVIGWIFERHRLSTLDPFPFILNLAFSTQAAYAGPIIMMSQNRAAQRDRQHAALDLQTNLEAKEEIESLRTALTRLETQKIDEILEILRDREEA